MRSTATRLSTFQNSIVIDQPNLLTFDEPRHAYTLAGRPVRSVTNLLHKVNLTNFDHVPPSILEAARIRGTVVHKAVHFFNERDLDVRDFMQSFPEYAGYLQSWIALMDTGRLQTFLCEQRVANFAPRYAGTFDWLGIFDGQATLIDFATGHPDDAAKHLQTAAYVLASRAWSHLPGYEKLKAFHDDHPYIQRFAVRLDRHGGLPQLTAYRDPRDFSVFMLIAEAVNAVDEYRPKSLAWNWEQDDFVAEVA
jgi:hypothetical protein